MTHFSDFGKKYFETFVSSSLRFRYVTLCAFAGLTHEITVVLCSFWLSCDKMHESSGTVNHFPKHWRLKSFEWESGRFESLFPVGCEQNELKL